VKIIPFNDLRRQYDSIKPIVDEAIARVLASGWYILGPEVEAFENDFAAYCGTSYCVGVANGTDALEIGLRALGISAEDEVITVANAGMYSTTAIRAIGALPVFADIVPDTMTLDPAALDSLTTARTRAVIVTHLYGYITRMSEIKAFTQHHGLALVEDCAQAHGAVYDGRRSGNWGDVGCFSFYPTKNLGALGDGGAIVTSNLHVTQRARMFRQYGWTRKYEAEVSGGRNSRLDELQAAVLRAKLPYLDSWNQSRYKIAKQYEMGLAHTPLRLPEISDGFQMVNHLFVIRVSDRKHLRAVLHEKGIGNDVHYPIPDHMQTVCMDLGYRLGRLPETEFAANEVLSLPCFPELHTSEVDQVISVIRDYFNC
jgi:dTDP-4-amino-4,6-dideoxygalactose transaminase